MEFKILGKLLLVMGAILIIFGLLLISNTKISALIRVLGKLPGDIVIHRKGFHLYFPITTCIILSILLSLLMWLFLRK